MAQHTPRDWVARVEWLQREPLDGDAIDVIMDRLEGHSPALGQDALDPTIWSATISVSRSTIRQASAVAVSVVEAATSGYICGVELLPEEVFDARSEQPLVPELVGTAEVADMLEVSRARVSQLRSQPGFPPPTAELRAGPVWVKDQVDLWASKWIRRSGPKPATQPVGDQARS